MKTNKPKRLIKFIDPDAGTVTIYDEQLQEQPYQPQAGDVCEWFNRWTGKIVQMMIVSPEPTENGYYLALDDEDLIYENYVHWFMFVDELKLIYRP